MSPEPDRSWNDTGKVDWYLDRVDRLEPRKAGEQALLEVVPDNPKRVLDLGCGDGRLAALVLEERPDVDHVVCTDISPAMIERAQERFVNDQRVTVRSHDMETPLIATGPFDVVVSGFAIHHLEHERKRSLFAEIAALLTPGGVFANLEVIASATPQRHQEFLHAVGREADDPEDRLATIEDQIVWMTDAGLTNVDCIWRWRGLALLVGEATNEVRRR